jgi:NADH dehydrogenase
VLGAGFGGLEAVRALKRAPVEVVLVDRHNFHLFTPLLYQVASALLEPAEVAHPVRALTRGIANARMWMAEVTEIALDRRLVTTDHGEIDYDFLVVAAGSVTNYFGNAELESGTFGLKSLEEGLALRNQILRNFELARWTDDTAERKRLLTFAIIGGGPTGVEFAGALSELVRLVLGKDFPGMDLEEVSILLIEGTDHLLGAFAPDLRKHAERALRKKKIETRYRSLVRAIRNDEIELSTGERIPVGAVVWTAGVRASPAGTLLGQPLQRDGTVEVTPTLQLPHHPEVFVIGDLAHVRQDGSPLPMLAPVAQQEGRHAARNIVAIVEGRQPAPFHYFDKGTMATIGRNAAVVQLRGLHLHGFPGWLTWLFVHLLLIVSLRSRLVVLINWAWDYFFYDRPVRLILRAAERPHD